MQRVLVRVSLRARTGFNCSLRNGKGYSDVSVPKPPIRYSMRWCTNAAVYCNNEAALQVTCTLALTCTPGLHAWLTTILIHTVLRRARVNSVRIRARDPYSDAVACRLAIEGCDFNLRLQGSSGAVSRSMAAVARARSRSRLATVGEYSPFCKTSTHPCAAGRPNAAPTKSTLVRTYRTSSTYTDTL